MRALFLIFIVSFQSIYSAVITTNILGEYFGLTTNSVERYIYGQLTITASGATLAVFPPPLTLEIAAQLSGLGLANIIISPATVTKTFSEILQEKKIGVDVEILYTANLNAEAGYQGNLSILGQVLNTNIYANPNPEQYFLLQMTPLTAGRTQNVYCDLYYNGSVTDKWLLPPNNDFPSQGVFISQTWKTPLILESTTNDPTKIKFRLEIPSTSFPNLQTGVYQIRIAAVMIPLQVVPSFQATQIGSLTRLLESAIATANAPNSVYIPNAAQLANILANQAYLVQTINAVAEAASE